MTPPASSTAELLADTSEFQIWKHDARRDDWHLRFVGSDIRQLIGEVERLTALVSTPPAGNGMREALEKIAQLAPENEVNVGCNCAVCQARRIAQRALTSPPSEATASPSAGGVPERETWWLAERIGHQQYTAERGELPSLTMDPWRAVRFKTEKEAFDYILRLTTLRDEMQATQHIFINKPHREHRFSFPPRDPAASPSAEADKVLADHWRNFEKLNVEALGVISASTPVSDTSPSEAETGREALLMREEAARVIDVHAQEMRNMDITITADGLSAIANVVRALLPDSKLQGNGE